MWESSLYGTYKVGACLTAASDHGWLLMRDDATVPYGAKRIDGATPKVLGFLIREHIRESVSGAARDVPVNTSVSVIRKGTVWAKVKNATKGGNLYFQKGTTDGGALGDLFGTVGATAADYVQVNGAICLDATTAEATCRVEINLPA
jgi:hypothetical protein